MDFKTLKKDEKYSWLAAYAKIGISMYMADPESKGMSYTEIFRSADDLLEGSFELSRELEWMHRFDKELDASIEMRGPIEEKVYRMTPKFRDYIKRLIEAIS